jgi:hypothetical protein
MLSTDPAEKSQPSSSPSGAKSASLAVPVMDAREPIEVAPGGNGTTNDPAASDRPPGVSDDLGDPSQLI